MSKPNNNNNNLLSAAKLAQTVLLELSEILEPGQVDGYFLALRRKALDALDKAIRDQEGK